MMFELNLLQEFVRDEDLVLEHASEHKVVVRLAPQLSLCFENVAEEGDTAIYFTQSTGGWHSHGDQWGDDVALVPIDILSGLSNGQLLVEVYRFANGRADIRIEKPDGGACLSDLEPGDAVTYQRLAFG